jgi:ABC-type nitrate/sulfonate/bicarbonate transport system substrate-binding protein
MNMQTTTGDNAPSIVLAGGAQGFNWLPVFVADRHGIFARHGVQVELRRMGTVDKATTAVRTGEAHMAITPPEGAIADQVSGGKLRIIAGNVNRLPLSLVANPRFTRIEDLRGAKLGTSSLTEGTAIYTREMLAQHGLTYPGDYEFSVVGVHPARWQALQAGEIDAAVQLIPLNFVAFDAGYANFGEVSDYIPQIVFTAVIADADWLSGNAGRIVSVLASLIEATAFVYDPANDAALLPIVMEITQSDAHYAQKSLDYMRDKAVFARQLEIPPAALATTIDLMAKADLLAPGRKEAAAATFDPDFADRARNLATQAG